MSEDTTIKTEVVEEVKKQPELILEEIPPSIFNYPTVYPLMQTLAKEMADASLGEYTLQDTMLCIKFNPSILYYAYVVPDKEVYLGFDHTRRVTDPKIEREFAGYALVTFNGNAPPHIWQAAIIPKYYHTNVLDNGFKALLKDLVGKFQPKEITMSALREGWEDKAKGMGFKSTFTVYRKKIENT